MKEWIETSLKGVLNPCIRHLIFIPGEVHYQKSRDYERTILPLFYYPAHFTKTGCVKCGFVIKSFK